jgi:hypothetical protein
MPEAKLSFNEVLMSKILIEIFDTLRSYLYANKRNRSSRNKFTKNYILKKISILITVLVYCGNNGYCSISLYRDE